MRRPPPQQPQPPPIVATVLPFPHHHHQQQQFYPNSHAVNNLNARRRILRGRIFLGLLVVVLVLQAIALPWLFLMGDTTATTASNSPPILKTTQKDQPQRPSDGTLNNYPIYLKKRMNTGDDSFHSSIHCVGETHNPQTAWMYRSCQLHNLCIDTQSREFVVVESPVEQNFQRKRTPHMFVSSELSYNASSMALGGINPRWQGNDFNQGISKVQWFPKVVSAKNYYFDSYYELDPNVLLVPFHSFAAHNVGHMLWDDFLPLFTLLQLFGQLPPDNNNKGGYAHPDKRLLLLRVDTLPLLYGTCEMRRNKQQKCAKNFAKFLPLLGVQPETFSTVKTMHFVPNEPNGGQAAAPPSLVCAKHAVAGLGMLTDHGMKDHGWYPEIENRVQNTAKGALLYDFRNFMLGNLRIPILPPQDGNFRILLSAHSSGDGPRDVSMENQHAVLQRAFPTVQLKRIELATLEMHQQMEMVSQTNVFISTCGGGSMTATFLPRGATLILYYPQTGGFDFQAFNLTGGPAYLDWDLFNNAAYLRVHWLPIETMDTKEGLESLMYLVRHEMDVASTGI